MTLEQMDKVVQDYCCVIGEISDELCADCRIKHLCEPIMGDFDRHPEALKQAYDIVSNNNGEHDGCCGCRFSHNDEGEYPCNKCKYTVCSHEPAYATRPLLHTPEAVTEVTPVALSTAVHHPDHYNQGGIECIDAMVSAFGKEATATFCHINAFKYVWRMENKNGLEDTDKAIWYLNKYKELKSSG